MIISLVCIGVKTLQAQFLKSGALRLSPGRGLPDSIAEVNGLPALLARDAQGAPIFVLSIGVKDGSIERIWAITNPDKLKGL